MEDRTQINVPEQLVAWLRAHEEYASGMTFILMQEQIPLYAIQPAGPFASKVYAEMFNTLDSALKDTESEQRVSLPGYISGSTRLMNGMTIPVVVPDLRGMYVWRSKDLVEAALAANAQIPTDQRQSVSRDDLLNFLNCIYYELRNMGVDPRDRALNYGATNAYQAGVAFADAAAKSLVLSSIDVVKSPICRPDSDCWDVMLTMFDDFEPYEGRSSLQTHGRCIGSYSRDRWTSP